LLVSIFGFFGKNLESFRDKIVFFGVFAGFFEPAKGLDEGSKVTHGSGVGNFCRADGIVPCAEGLPRLFPQK
jgi:hypothetical protein